MKHLIALLTLAITAASAGEPTTEIYAERDSAPLHLDIHYPTTRKQDSFPVIFWIHGGGWRQGSRLNYRLVEWLIDDGYAVVSIDYRLTNVAPFPAQIMDCRDALSWIRENGKKHQLNTDQLFTAGLSAGAHLASLLALSDEVASPSPIRGILHFYGPSDFVQMARYAKAEEAPANQPDSNVYALLNGPLKERLDLAKEASPISYLNAGDPPLLILVGTEDTLMTQRQCLRLHEAAVAAGVPATIHQIEGAGHGGPEFSNEETKGLIRKFLQSHSP